MGTVTSSLPNYNILSVNVCHILKKTEWISSSKLEKPAFERPAGFADNQDYFINNLDLIYCFVLFFCFIFYCIVTVDTCLALQLASGAFGHIKDTVLSALNREPTTDISPETVGTLSLIMLAQAQEVIFLKATSGTKNKKDELKSLKRSLKVSYDHALIHFFPLSC